MVKNLRRVLLPVAVAAGVLGGGCAGNPLKGVGEIASAPYDVVKTAERVTQEEGLLQGFVQLPNAFMNGAMRVIDGVGHVFSPGEAREFGEYHPLAESKLVTGAAWFALGGYAIPGITAVEGAVLGTGVGVLHEYGAQTRTLQ